MHPTIASLLKQVHDTETLAVITATGGGASAIAWVQGVPGGSRTLLQASLPYHPTALEEALGYAPEQAVSEEVALILAENGYHEAERLAGSDKTIVGIGCTATLATDRLKRGTHRCHLAAMDAERAVLHSLEFTKDLRSRQEEETVVSRLLVQLLAEACGLQAGLDLGLSGEERVSTSRWDHLPALRPFLHGHQPALTLPRAGDLYPGVPPAAGILSGSFNPLHRGHQELAQVAARTLGGEVAYELPVWNADKPSLTELQVRRRAAQFSGWATLILTRAPTFAEKADLFPGRVFVLGVDTALRVVAPRFYKGMEEGVRKALAQVRERGCRFLVAGRQERGQFLTLDGIGVPPGFEDLFDIIPESAFRVDISSSALRRSLEG